VGRVLQSGIPEKFESYAAPLGKWIAVSIYSPEKGYFVGLVDNITERKVAEEKIKEINVELEERVAKRTDQLRKTNDELEAFSYSVSHDLRAPLRAIIGFTAILEEDYSNQLDNEARRITGIIKNNTVKMGNLIDDLLSFSRMGRQDVIKTDINFTSLVNEIAESIDDKENGNTRIKWNIHPLPVVKADINTMRQVWINLISNAVKYSGKTEESVIEIGAFNENGHVIFYVKDNGIGFDEKYRNKLFKVFQRLHSSDEFEGTGIGLAIVEKIISKHGGEVWAEAVLNEGATFFFSLPEKEPEIV
jgi:light-regulated signal transduction histidine kinase (bacteriophytochrome)